ncbi:MAG TPA: plasmid pRiA4b ORF-3 family protein [Actinomycetes bacterium]|nr:plasmid pRiA4b ORF-3 family protein [Actinomycetes bacterium]
MHRLTVSLVHMVPPTRRQVEVWSDLTLAGLHEVIQVLFDWDGDHLYEFVVGRRRYADPGYLDGCEDDDVSLAEVAGRAGKVIGYTYDLGACWEHRIVVDAVEPALAGARSPRCVAGVGPHPAEYDHDRPRRLDLGALNKQLAKLPLHRKAPASASAQAAATPQVRALAAAARRACLLQDLVRLARWTATPRAVTPTGVLKKPEVAGALRALGLPAPPAGFHSARHLPRLDACWRLAEDLGLLDISSKDAIPGPGLAALEDDGQTLELWTSLWELAAVDGRVLIYNGRAIGYLWVTPPLLWALWQAQMPMSAAELALVRPGHDQVGFVAWVLDQLVAVGGVERLGDGRYQLTPLGRHGHLAVLDHDPRGSAWR